MIQEMMSPATDKIFAALCKAQSEMKIAPKDSSNPFFKSKYADLQTVWETIKEPLHNNGLCIIQTLKESGDNAALVTTLGHVSGQWIKSEMPMKLRPIRMNKEGQLYEANLTPQELCAMITYFRRTSKAAISGCVAGEVDDDGETAMGRPTTQAASPQIRKPVSPPMASSPIKITQEMWSTLDGLMFELSDDEHIRMICDHLNIPTIHAMKPTQYNAVVKSITDRLKERENESARMA